MFLLLANLLMLFVGCFLEPTAAITILVPILLPIATQLGIDPVHFGLVMVLNLMIGLLHPPMGMVLFVLARVAKLSVERTTMAILPWLVPLLVSLVILTYVPAIGAVAAAPAHVRRARPALAAPAVRAPVRAPRMLKTRLSGEGPNDPFGTRALRDCRLSTSRRPLAGRCCEGVPSPRARAPPCSGNLPDRLERALHDVRRDGTARDVPGEGPRRKKCIALPCPARC